ncbi:MAG TPA: cysteine--tRNA ligase [Gemmataceae bacterium]|jgi:cysteinyl-tRNA synthetase|nr:cysteine--tRNA ligase [Gemmataceae bacterium]
MSLRVYNTLTRQKEAFQTVRPGRVGMYVCGPTVYKPSHVGHMVGPVIFDTVKRYLSYVGYRVTLVVNITDVDDKLIVQAKKQNTTVAELAERVTADYRRNLQRLGVTGIDAMPRATEYIGEIIRIIAGLIDKGFAYPAGGDVYFDVTRDADYGKLCHRDPEQLEAGSRIEVSERKRNPGDFALWKGAKPGEPEWDSPWGPGRPGWHIECSAMSMDLLGPTLDIHGGGLDLQFPHHENELAQSECFTGETFVRYWMHNGLMKVGSGKMSKSQGNEIVVSEVLQRHQPETLRFFLLSTHYRRPIDYSEERLEEVRRAMEGFYRFFERFQRITKREFYQLQAPATRGPFDAGGANPEFLAELGRHREAFLGHMDDDFNTGGAIGVLQELLAALNRFADARRLEGPETDAAAVGDFIRGAAVLKELSQILGVFQEPQVKPTTENDRVVAGLMQLLIDLRAEARKGKNFALADQIRRRLAELGVTLEDRPGGTGWRLA